MRGVTKPVLKRLSTPSLIAVFCAALASNAQASPFTFTFVGQNVTVVGEFVNGVPVAVPHFAPFFLGSQTINGSLTYDTSQPNLTPGGPYGLYNSGSLSLVIPEIGLSASRSSNSMQISVFDHTPNPDDQFFAFVNGVDSFSGSVGLPNPLSFDMLLFGTVGTMFDDHSLPTGPIPWTFGNASFNFLDSTDNTDRQVLLTFTPGASAVPEPTTLILLTTGLTGLVVIMRRRSFREENS